MKVSQKNKKNKFLDRSVSDTKFIGMVLFCASSILFAKISIQDMIIFHLTVLISFIFLSKNEKQRN